MIVNSTHQTRIKDKLRPVELTECERFGQRINRLGANFAVCNSEGEILLLCEGNGFRSSPQRLVQLALQTLVDTSESENKDDPVTIHSFNDTHTVLGGALWRSVSNPPQEGQPRAVALVDMGETSTQCSPGLEGHRGNPMRQGQRFYLTEMLGAFVESFRSVVRAEKHVEMIGSELAYVYEELVLLHKLGTHMKVTESDANFLQMACDNLTELIPVAGIAILLEREDRDNKSLAIAAGSGLIDFNPEQAAVLYHRLSEEIGAGKEALMDSNAFGNFTYEWQADIRSIIAVPLFAQESRESPMLPSYTQTDYIMGIMVAVNPLERPDFDSTDIKLFNSVANRCAVFVENGRLFSDLKDLFLGSLRALIHSIDAKDGYTHGHSERVAFISRWIAMQAAAQHIIRPEQIHEAYFAGLLHDIGKIGIDDWILRKKGMLTEKERLCVQKHPEIGAGILRGIKQMRNIVSSVLCHHERMDGSGYPQGLHDKEIPLIARIVGIADCFDAMTSARSYRKARTVEETVEEIASQLGKQFDQTIGRLFLDTDIPLLWEILQADTMDAHHGPGWENFAGLAIGTLIR